MQWTVNPRLAVSPAALHVVRLAWRGRGGMAPGPMPDAGGINDQAAWLIVATGMVLAVDDETKPKPG